jgi:MFS family permease
MVEKAIKKIIRKRHFWRTVGFDELSEIYMSQMLRSLAVNLVGVFVPIYLYKIGYSLIAISAMYLVWFMVRPLWAVLSAKIIGAWGPKHAIALSVVIQILYLALILTVNTFNWPLWVIGSIGSLCFGLFLMAFNVDFSKIKHTEHGGKEISFLQMFERIGASCSVGIWPTVHYWFSNYGALLFVGPAFYEQGGSKDKPANCC